MAVVMMWDGVERFVDLGMSGPAIGMMISR